MKVRNRSISAVTGIAFFLLFAFSLAIAQETQTAPATAPPLTPAQERAQARAAAAAQRKAENQAKAQARAQAKTQKQAGMTPVAAPSAAQPAQPANAMATPASNARPASGATAPAPADRGTLTQGNVIFTPVNCVHNGTKAVCTFTFVNQGNPGNMAGVAILATAQFVDDAHVPHRSDARYFLDKYGTRQAKLYANSGDTGTFVAEYVNVDARVTTGEFHMRDQTVGGITVGQPSTAPSQGAAKQK